MNILSNYAGRAVGLVIGFFLVPFLIAKLGAEVFGLIILFEALMMIVEAISTSIRVALSRFVTFSVAQEAWDEFKAYLSTSRTLFWGLAAGIFALGLAISPWVPVIFRVPVQEQQSCRILFALMSCSFAMTIPNTVYWAGLYARQRFDLINLASSASTITRGLLIFILFGFFSRDQVSIVTYGWVYLVVTWIQNILIFIAFRHVFPAIRIANFGRWDGDKIRRVLSFSFYSFTGHMSQMLHDNVVNFFVNRLWGPAANAMWGVGMKFPVILENAVAQPTWTLAPSFTDLAARNENEKLKKLLFVYSKGLTILVVPVCLVLIAFSFSLIRFWVGDAFAESANLMVIAHLAQIVYLPIVATHNLPNVYGKMKVPAMLNIVMVIVSVCSGLYFANVLHMGMSGLALGVYASALIYSFFYMLPYSMKLAGFSVSEYLRKAFFKPLLWAGVSWGSGFGIVYLVEKSFPISLFSIGVMAFCLVIYAAGVYFWVLEGRERGYVQEAWQNIRTRLYSASDGK